MHIHIWINNVARSPLPEWDFEEDVEVVTAVEIR
jgi:hypothetical protein